MDKNERFPKAAYEGNQMKPSHTIVSRQGETIHIMSSRFGKSAPEILLKQEMTKLVQQVKRESANGSTKTEILLPNMLLNWPEFCLALLHYRMRVSYLFLQAEGISLFDSPDKKF